jgi:hypothetical protein
VGRAPEFDRAPSIQFSEDFMIRRPPIPIPPVGVFLPEAPPLIPPDFQWVGSSNNWRANWSIIVSGRFSNAPFSCLLCYDRASGVAAFYETDGAGGVQLLQEFTDWRTSWTHIVPGVFGNSGYDGLLLYDQDAGFAAIYDTDGQGNLKKLREYDDWRTTWAQIVLAPFDDSRYSGFLLYDQSAGFGAIYGTDGNGGIKLLREYSDWRTSWTAIVAGQFSDKNTDRIFADLFFFEGSTGYGETYATDGKGGISMLSGQSGFPPATDILGGNFGCMGNFQEWTNLLFFNRPTNVGTIFAFSVYSDGTQDAVLWKRVETIQPQSLDPIVVAKPMLQRSVIVGPIVPIRPWSLLAPGNFWMVDQNDEYFGTNGTYPQYRTLYNGGCTDLLFYDNEEGTIQFYLKETAQTTPQEKLCGYASARSVLPGETIQFHISSQVGAYRIDVYRQGVNLVYMASVPLNLGPARAYGISRSAFEEGAQWPAAASLTIPATWPSGLYLARLQAGGPPIFPGPGEVEAQMMSARSPAVSATAAATSTPVTRFFPDLVTYDIPFVVRPTSPGSQARILLAAADTTYEAYNYWGGRSLYGHGCSGLDSSGNPGAIAHIWSAPYGLLQPRALEVSFLRPFASAVGVLRMQTFEIPMIQWLERNGFRVDVCAASDLHKFPELLSNYRLLVSVGHDEYWSEEMRDNVEAFLENGGNAAFLSGNTCWWAVRFTLDGNKMICCKDKVLDPDTVTWNDLHRSAMSMVGTDDYNVWPNVPPDPPNSMQYFVVEDESHWAFEGTGLSNDDTFGVYLRPDGTFVCVVGGETNNNGQSGILATATFIDTSDNNRAYTGTMVSFQKGKGTVFNAASINWVTGLSQQAGLWNSADQITWNVFNRLG